MVQQWEEYDADHYGQRARRASEISRRRRYAADG